MRLRTATVVAIGGYLIGSISFARLVGRKVAAGEDLSQTTLDLPGDATMTYSAVSATSIGVRAGPLWGITTSALDIAKAYLPTLLARRRWPGESYHLVVATATLVGHNYPLYHRFKGGRGQTVIYGSVLAIDWVAVPATSAAGMLIGFGALREIFVAYTLGMGAHPLVRSASEGPGDGVRSCGQRSVCARDDSRGQGVLRGSEGRRRSSGVFATGGRHFTSGDAGRGS